MAALGSGEYTIEGDNSLGLIQAGHWRTKYHAAAVLFDAMKMMQYIQ